MRCSHCRHENREGARFCAACGRAFASERLACGRQPPPGAAFCDYCGTHVAGTVPTTTPSSLTPLSPTPHAYTPKHLAEKVLTSRGALERERRQVTVLLADVAGFTAMAEQLDPEVVHQIIDGCFASSTAEMPRLEGTINQYTGDGVMALFGAPIAHEDGPRRAVHAALGIQRALREYSQQVEAQRGPTPLVGRARELAMLLDRFREVKEGRGPRHPGLYSEDRIGAGRL